MRLRLFDKAAFSEPLIFKDPYFFKAVMHFRKCYFSEDTVYWKMLFSTANLVFTVSLFIYRLVINPGVFRFKFPGVYRKVHHSENRSMKYYEQKFCIKLAFQGSFSGLSIETCKNSVSGVSIKMSIPVLNFSTK